MTDYETLARSMVFFADKLEAEAHQANTERDAAIGIIKQLIPDMPVEEMNFRLRQFEVRAEELGRTAGRLRSILASIASRRVANDDDDDDDDENDEWGL